MHVISKLCSNYNLRLIWEPRHRNLAGNKTADDWQGSEIDLVSPELGFGVSYIWTTTHITTWAKDGAIYLRVNSRKPKAVILRTVLKHGHNNIRTLINVVTGKCCLNKHFHTISLTQDPICAAAVIETVIHSLCICPQYMRH